MIKAEPRSVNVVADQRVVSVESDPDRKVAIKGDNRTAKVGPEET